MAPVGVVYTSKLVGFSGGLMIMQFSGLSVEVHCSNVTVIVSVVGGPMKVVSDVVDVTV